MRRILAQTRKELTHLGGDRLALGLVLVLPVCLTALLGTSISLTVTDIPIVIQDLDQTPLSRRYADMFRSSLTFRVVTLPPATSPAAMLDRGTTRAAIIIPEHFERQIRRARPAEAQALVDATDGNTARLTRGNAGQITSAFAQQFARTGTRATIQTATRLWFNPGRDPGQFYGPGFLVLSFLLSGLIFPIENIPDGLRWVSNLVQARYYIVIVRDAFLQGGGWPAVWWAVLAVGAIGLVFYALAWRTMRRMQVKA